MKSIIKGKMYNTETATLVGSYDNGGTPRDFTHFSEDLYRKSNGEYFLYGEGGPLSKYSVPYGSNGSSGSERITPFTPEEAMNWAEAHLSADEYIAEFGEVPE